MAKEMLLSEIKERVLRLTLDRPKANAFNDDLIAALQGAFKEARRNTEIRTVLLSAKGKLFSAGQDVGALGGEGEEISFRAHLLKKLQSAYQANPPVGKARDCGD